MKITLVLLILLFPVLIYFWWVKRNKFPMVYERHGNECGPACLAMIAKYYEKNTDLDAIGKWAGMDHQSGTTAKGLIDAAKKIGLRGLPVKIKMENGRGASLLNAPLPCILHWRGHYFVVLYKIFKNRYYVAHPREGKVVYDKGRFARNWEIPNQKEGIAILFEL